MNIRITNKISALVFALLVLILFGTSIRTVAQPLRANGKIAFTSDRDGNREIYVMNADGTKQTRLTNNNIIDDQSKWSPDGKKIAFLSQNASGTTAIFLMNADGTGKTEVASVAVDPQSPSSVWHFSMSWSPDGGKIVYSDSNSNLYIVNADGSNRRILRAGLHPAWSPDGSKILFLLYEGGWGLNVYTIRPDGTALQNVTPTLPTTYSYRISGNPVWSPDGLKFAFSSTDYIATSAIFIANANGSNTQYFLEECAYLVPNGCGGPGFPAWSPNGRTIAFTNFGSLNTEIYVKDFTSESRRLTNTPGSNFNPNWQPIAKAFPDFDGDGRADVSVFRPSDRVWYLNQSTNGFSAAQFGLSTDKLAPADFDGDGKTDISVYRDGVWYWLKSSDNSFNTLQFGIAGDIPVPADYDDGDGRAELTIYRDGVWWSLNLASNQTQVINFGLSGSKPVPADYDGDGRIDQAVYRGSGEWHINRSSQGYTVIQFGLPNDKPVPADYDGDGKTDLAVYRDGVWYLQQSINGFAAFQFGVPTDIPAPADFDGDGRADAAVFRDGAWYLMQSTNGFSARQFGLANDRPVPSVYLP